MRMRNVRLGHGAAFAASPRGEASKAWFSLLIAREQARPAKSERRSRSLLNARFETERAAYEQGDGVDAE